MNIVVGTFGGGEEEYLAYAVKMPLGLNFITEIQIQAELGTVNLLSNLNITRVCVQVINIANNTGSVCQVVPQGFANDTGLQMKNRDIYTCTSYRDLANTIFYNLFDTANTYFQINVYAK